MRRTALPIAAALLTTAVGLAAGTQKTTPVHPGKGGSPHVRSDWTVDGANISVECGRPSLKGRLGAGDAARSGVAHRRR